MGVNLFGSVARIMKQDLSEAEIVGLWPEFVAWVHKKYGYFTVDGIYTVKLWYEFLREKSKS